MWQPQRLVGLLLALGAAILLLVSPFFPLFTGDFSARATEFRFVITGWGFDTDAPQRLGAVAVNAYGLIFSAVLLFVATVAMFVTARRSATPSNRRVSAAIMAIASAFTLGVAVSVLPQLTNWVDTFRPLGAGLARAQVHTSVGLGFWMMAVGTVFALAATVIAVLPVRDTEPATPPYGIAIPVEPSDGS